MHVKPTNIYEQIAAGIMRRIMVDDLFLVDENEQGDLTIIWSCGAMEQISAEIESQIDLLID